MGLTTLILILSISVLASDAALAPRTNDVLSEQLYNNVIVGDYTNAVAQTRDLANEQKFDVIEDVVTRLLRDAKRNVIEYAYQLWINGLDATVKQHFPIQFRLIIDGNFVKFINRRDGLALKLAIDTDGDGDRLSYGDAHDKTSHRVSWKMIPVWDNNRVYFKILNTHRNQYLKLEVSSDGAGDHKAFGSDESDTYRHQWYLYPVKYENDVLFYVFNREYSQALKLGRDVDSMGDRMLWGHNGNVLGNPEIFGWFIVPY